MHIPQEAPKSREPPRPKSQTGAGSAGVGGVVGKPPRQRSVTPPPLGGITGGTLTVSPAQKAGGGGFRGSSPSKQANEACPSELPNVPPRTAVVAASKGEARLCLVAILSGQPAAVSIGVSPLSMYYSCSMRAEWTLDLKRFTLKSTLDMDRLALKIHT